MKEASKKPRGIFDKLTTKFKKKHVQPPALQEQPNSPDLPLHASLRQYIDTQFTARGVFTQVLDFDNEIGYLSLDAMPQNPGTHLEDVFLAQDGSMIAKRTQLIQEGDENLYLYFNGDFEAQINMHHSSKDNYWSHGASSHFKGEFGYIAVLYHYRNNLDIQFPAANIEHTLFRREEDGAWRVSAGLGHPGFQEIAAGGEEEIEINGHRFQIYESDDMCQLRAANASDKEITVLAAPQDVFKTQAADLFELAKKPGKEWANFQRRFPVRMHIREPLPKKD